MEIDKIIEGLQKQKLLILPKENLDEILNNGTVLEDKDTLMSDHIRPCRWG